MWYTEFMEKDTFTTPNSASFPVSDFASGLLTVWLIPMQARLTGWLVGVVSAWIIFGFSVILIGMALWFNMQIFPFVALAMALLLIVTFVVVSFPRPEGDSPKKGK